MHYCNSASNCSLGTINKKVYEYIIFFNTLTVSTVSRSLNPSDEYVIIPEVKLFWIILLDPSLRSAARRNCEAGNPVPICYRQASDTCTFLGIYLVMKVFVNKENDYYTFGKSKKLNQSKTHLSDEICSWHNRQRKHDQTRQYTLVYI